MANPVQEVNREPPFGLWAFLKNCIPGDCDSEEDGNESPEKASDAFWYDGVSDSTCHDDDKSKKKKDNSNNNFREKIRRLSQGIQPNKIKKKIRKLSDSIIKSKITKMAAKANHTLHYIDEEIIFGPPPQRSY